MHMRRQMKNQSKMTIGFIRVEYISGVTRDQKALDTLINKLDYDAQE